MKRLLTLFAVLSMGGAQLAYANPDLQKIIDDPNQWAIQTGDYANQRYSKLDQINKDNVGKMQVAWTFVYRASCVVTKFALVIAT